MERNFMASLPEEGGGGELAKATIVPLGTYVGKKGDGKNAKDEKPITVLFNPKEYTIEKSVNWQSKGTVGKDGEHIEYTGGDNETLAMELFCDTTRQDIDVRAFTDQIRALTQIDEDLGHPRLVEFRWGTFAFRGVITRLSQKFTHFNRAGTPVRASLNITFKESKPLWMAELAQRRSEYKDIDIIKYGCHGLPRRDSLVGEGTDWGEGLPGNRGGGDHDVGGVRPTPGRGGGDHGGDFGGDGDGRNPTGLRDPANFFGGGGNPDPKPGVIPPGGDRPGTRPGGGVNPGGVGGQGSDPKPRLTLRRLGARTCKVGEELELQVQFANCDEVTLRCEPADGFKILQASLREPAKIKIKGNKDGMANIIAEGMKGGQAAVKDEVKVKCVGQHLKLEDFGYLAG